MIMDRYLLPARANASESIDLPQVVKYSASFDMGELVEA
jgi:hypothetical protein